MIADNNDALPLTRGDLAQFCALLCEGLNPAKTGDLVPSFMVEGLHSDSPAEYDETVRVRLFDLVGDRTGIEGRDGKIRYAD